MQVPVEISFKNVPKKEGYKTLIDEEVYKLETMCEKITSCHVALEQPQAHIKSGNPFRVRVDLLVPRGHEIVVTREPGEGNMHDPLSVVIRDAFHAVRQQLQKVIDKNKRKVKVHPNKVEEVGKVVKVFEDKGFGFISSKDGDEIYFHKNSVLHNKFAKIKIGSEVRFVEEMGDKGPQASTVQLLTSPRGDEITAD